MPNLRSQVAKVVYSGTIGTGANPAEIWSTSFWVAGYGDNAADQLASFQPLDYINNHAKAFMVAYQPMMNGAFTCTLIKCNIFGLDGIKVKQLTDPTVELAVTLAGAGQPAATTNVLSVGWRLQTTAASRGNATQGRMFLPATSIGSNAGPFDGNGHWDPIVLSSISTPLTTAWNNLKADDGPVTNSITYLPSVVTTPSVKNSLTQFEVNAADITTVESNVWVLRSRKNALRTGGTRTLHPSFA